MRPGKVLGEDHEGAFGPLSVIDHAHLASGTLVKMHEHKNDEILSYLVSGSMVHQDSTGERIAVSPRKLMLMNAGKSFWHEESVPEGAVEMLQIFVRPREADLPGKVQFLDRAEPASEGWMPIAGPEGEEAPLSFRQDVFVLDGHFPEGVHVALPERPEFDSFVYVMTGSIAIGDETLEAGDAFAIEDGDVPPIETRQPTTLVLFQIDPIAEASTAGTISGKA